MGWVTRLTEPAGQAPAALVRPTTWFDELKHRLVCRCHWVRQPPGLGGVAVEPLGMTYMAATSRGPVDVLAYTSDCGAAGLSTWSGVVVAFRLAQLM